MTVAQTDINRSRRISRRVIPLDITVLAGGPGVEREVSLQSGKAVYEALVRFGHHVTLCDITPDDLSALDIPADFVFIALHGEFGEDGTVQHLLEEKRLPYAGTGSAAARLAMNKVKTKRRLEETGIATPAFVVVTADNLYAFDADISPPVVVKPIDGGSSVDTSIERSVDGMNGAARTLVTKLGSALVERYIAGPELTVGILGDEALPVCEIRTRREFYNYEAKYIDDDTQYLFDLELPQALLQQIQADSLQAHRVLGCHAFSRVDWMVDAGKLQPYVLEVNTIPGFTSHSLLPKAAARAGIHFDQLCNRIVELSMNTPKD